MNRHVFIDLGCYNGDTVEEFRNWRKVAFDRTWEWEIFAFDINPAFKEQWDNIADEHTHFSRLAAWISDEIIEVSIEQSETPLGSTAMSGKKAVWATGKKIEVGAINFSRYIWEYFSDDAFVVVKMDIEGAEFPILEKMLKEKTIQHIDLLLCEFHPNKVVEYTTTHKNELIKRIKDAGVDVLEWH